MSETTPMRPALKRQTTTARLQSAKKSTDNKMQSLSMWTSPLTEPVEWPTLHLLAFVLYGAGMIYYIVTASIAWANYERPVLFETQPTSNFDVVPLNFSIDCRDCRRFVSRQPDSRLWTLSWDYTDVPGGCAERNPELFDAELVAFCAAQHNATLFDQARSGDLRDDYYAIPFAQCPNAFDYTIPYTFTMGGVTQYAPASLQRTPQGEPNVTACMERCSNTAGCVGFGFTNVTFRDARFGVDFPAGSCALLSAQKCTLFDPVDTIAGPVTVYYKKLPPSGTPPPNPLDKCSITSGDVGMFAQRASLDPSAATSVNEAYRSGFGWNPNYIGESPVNSLTMLGDNSTGFHFGPVTADRGKGSFYGLHYPVPLCYAGEGAIGPDGRPRGMFLEILSVPHHAFADPVQIGHAVVSIASTDGKFHQASAHPPTLRMSLQHPVVADGPVSRACAARPVPACPHSPQENSFQPWHKNTMHLGLTVNRDENEAVTSSVPWFANFQYDGRVDWGKEESAVLANVLDARQMVQMVLGDAYDGRSQLEAAIIDGLIADGRPIAGVAALNDSQLAGFIHPPDPRNPTGGPYKLIREFEWRQDASKAQSVGSPYQGRRMHAVETDGASQPWALRRHAREGADSGVGIAPAFEAPDGGEGITSAHAPDGGEGIAPAFEAPALGAEGVERTTVPTAARGRRRLSQHDEWGGVLLTLRLSRFANVYTLGPKQTVLDLVAIIGGASGSLIGLLGFAIFFAELIGQLVKRLASSRVDVRKTSKTADGVDVTSSGV